MASSCISVLCGTFIGLLDPNPCSCRRIMMIWSERRGFWTLARIPFAVTKRHREQPFRRFCCQFLWVFFSKTTILGTIFDIPGISVPGHQTGNSWFVHIESQHKVPDWTMPMALSRLVNRTISLLNTWPIDHGPDRISILKLSRSNFCEHTPPVDLVLNLLQIWCNIHSFYHTDTQMADLHNGIRHAQINSRRPTLIIYTKTLDGAEHILSSLYHDIEYN